jgi:hypothetical protein
MARNGYTISGVEGKAHAILGMASGIHKTSALMDIASDVDKAEELIISSLNACIPLFTGGFQHVFSSAGA